MKTCLKNIKYLYFNNSTNDFEYYVGHCFIENGLITGFSNEELDESKFEVIIDMTGRLIFPMLCNMNVNLDEIIYKRLRSNWDIIKFDALLNSMGFILNENNKEYYDEIAPRAMKETVNQGVGLIATNRCYKTATNAPIFSLCAYPISRARYMNEYLSHSKIDSIMESRKSPNIIHGFNIRNLYDNDDGSLQFIKQYMNRTKFISCTIAQDTLAKNLVRQKWTKDELTLLNQYDLLHANTLLYGCNDLSEAELKRIKDFNANIIYTPLMSKTLNITPPNPLMAESLGINWCIASGSPSACDSINMIYVMQEVSKIMPALSKKLILRSTTINPLRCMQKICGVDISGQANFTIVNAPYNFNDANEAINYLFSANINDLAPQLMMNGNVVSYEENDEIEKNKNILRTYYKKLDVYFENPNTFEQEVKQIN